VPLLGVGTDVLRGLAESRQPKKIATNRLERLSPQGSAQGT